jgi:hypothetical protein
MFTYKWYAVERRFMTTSLASSQLSANDLPHLQINPLLQEPMNQQPYFGLELSTLRHHPLHTH